MPVNTLTNSDLAARKSLGKGCTIHKEWSGKCPPQADMGRETPHLEVGT